MKVFHESTLKITTALMEKIIKQKQRFFNVIFGLLFTQHHTTHTNKMLALDINLLKNRIAFLTETLKIQQEKPHKLTESTMRFVRNCEDFSILYEQKPK